MHSPRVWWCPPGSKDVFTMEASDSGTSLFRFVPFKLNGEFPSIAWKGHVVKAVFPEEGTVRLDEIYENRSALFNSIPKLILKSKSVFENKEANQIDLFGDNFQTNDQIVDKNDEWISYMTLISCFKYS